MCQITDVLDKVIDQDKIIVCPIENEMNIDFGRHELLHTFGSASVLSG